MLTSCHHLCINFLLDLAMLLWNNHHAIHANQKHRSSSTGKNISKWQIHLAFSFIWYLVPAKEHFSLICLSINRWYKSILYIYLHYMTNNAFYKNNLNGNIYYHVVLVTRFSWFYDNWWSILIKWKEWKKKLINLLTSFSVFIAWQLTKFCSIYQYIEIHTRYLFKIHK